MLYTVTALDVSGAVLWTTDVPATCFEQAVGLATRRSSHGQGTLSNRN
jgi:hypothetical protein